MQEFYSAHGKDADFIALNVFKTASVIKVLGKGMRKVNSVTLRPIIAKTFLREALTARQLRIEIWTNESGNKGKWSIERQVRSTFSKAALVPDQCLQASPGNLQQVEDLLFVNEDMETSPIVMAVKITAKGDSKMVGIAFADASNREIGISEFVDNDLFSNTEVCGSANLSDSC